MTTQDTRAEADRNGESAVDGRRPGLRLERRAAALMTGFASSSLIGIVFWAVAARLYAPAEVGRASALISTAVLLATLSQLNLGNVYARFLGSAGDRQRHFIFVGYAAVAGVAVLLGTGYELIGASSVLFDGVVERLLFPLGVAVLAVFAVQDLVLVSIHRASWVPVENVAFGLAKLGLLAIFATALPTGGIELSWVLCTAVAVAVVSAYLALRRNTPAPSTAVRFPAPRELAGAVGAEYVVGMASTAVPLVLPLLVVYRLGVDANAYFSVAWLFGTAMNLLLWSIAAVALVELSGDPAGARPLLVRSLRLALGVAALGGVAMWFLGPILLGFFGPEYQSQGTPVLRTLALAAPSTAIVVVWTTAARARGRMRVVIPVQIGISIAMVSLSAVLLGSYGTTGIGIAYLTVQTVVAAFLVRPLYDLTRRRGRHALGHHDNSWRIHVPRS